MLNKHFLKMRPEERELFVERTLKTILEKSKFGISISDVEKLKEFSLNRKTISKYFEKFVALNEAYSKKIGSVVLYYPNHKSPHFTKEKEKKIGDKKYRLTIVENPLGEFVYVQEIEEDSLYGEKVSGGILIPKNSIKEFLDFMGKEMKKNG